MCEGLLYYISNFKVVSTHGSSKPIESDIALVFGSKTEITDCLHGKAIPRYKFNLSSWPEMASRADRNAYLSGLRTKLPLNPNYLTKMILDSVFHVNIHSFCAFLDVGGVIIKAGDMEYAINDVKRLNLTLIDSR